MSNVNGLVCRTRLVAACVLAFLVSAGSAFAANLSIPNASFDLPPVPPTSPYASPEIDSWQKSAQPVWYDPAQNADTPWEYLMGEFYNVSFPGQFIDNCDGTQASFLFALPEAALFQDYDSLSGTNTTPSHAFNVKYNLGATYDLTVGVIGGGGSMLAGTTLQLSLYYRDALSNKVTVASTSITNSTDLFPTTTHFVDFQVHVPTVKTTDPWAGQNIGIQITSTASFQLAGGYWDLDNVRLVETPAGIALIAPSVSNGRISFTISSQPGAQFEIQSSPVLPGTATDWVSLGTLTNTTGVTVFSDSTTGSNQRFYRARQL